MRAAGAAGGAAGEAAALSSLQVPDGELYALVQQKRRMMVNWFESANAGQTKKAIQKIVDAATLPDEKKGGNDGNGGGNGGNGGHGGNGGNGGHGGGAGGGDGGLEHKMGELNMGGGGVGGMGGEDLRVGSNIKYKVDEFDDKSANLKAMMPHLPGNFIREAL